MLDSSPKPIEFPSNSHGQSYVYVGQGEIAPGYADAGGVCLCGRSPGSRARAILLCTQFRRVRYHVHQHRRDRFPTVTTIPDDVPAPFVCFPSRGPRSRPECRCSPVGTLLKMLRVWHPSFTAQNNLSAYFMNNTLAELLRSAELLLYNRYCAPTSRPGYNIVRGAPRPHVWTLSFHTGIVVNKSNGFRDNYIGHLLLMWTTTAYQSWNF